MRKNIVRLEQILEVTRRVRRKRQEGYAKVQGHSHC